MQRSRFSFWFYLALIGILVIAVVYYQGLTADVSAIGPYLVQFGSLAQGRNPYTGNFSQYPSTATPTQSQGAGPSAAQIRRSTPVATQLGRIIPLRQYRRA